jgi:hypothetical protein
MSEEIQEVDQEEELFEHYRFKACLLYTSDAADE